MKSYLLPFLLCVATAGLLNGQMTIDPAGPVNAASYIPNGLPNSGVARGAIFIVKGTNLCSTGFKKVETYPLPLELEGTRVLINVRGTSTNAFMIYKYGGLKDADGNTFDQIAVLLPSMASPGDGTMTIYYGGRQASAPIRVLNTGPGIFTLSQAGRGPGVITDNDRWQANTVTNSFSETTWANIWVTGLGPLPGGARDDVAAPFGNIDVPVEVYVGGQKLDSKRVNYHGRTTCCSGLDQVQFLPPPGVTGCSVPVWIKVNSFVSNSVTMSLGPNLRCSDPIGPTASELDRIQSGQPVNKGRVALVRTDLKITSRDSSGTMKTTEGTVDVGYGRFSKYDAAYAPFSQEIVGLPTLGSCIVQYGATKKPNSFEKALNLTADPVPHTVLNAGTNLNLNGQGGTRQVGAPGTAAGPAPTTVQITMKNSGSDAAHMFISPEQFGPGNKLDVGGSRSTTIPWVNGLKLDFKAGRNGTVTATGSATLTPSISKIEVVFDETSILKISTSGGSSSGIGMFQTAVTSGYYKMLGAQLKGVELDPEAKIDPLYLTGGNYGMTTQPPGGANGVGQINANVNIPTANRVDWTDKNSATNIVRASGYTVRWSGGDPATEHVVIYGHSGGTSSGDLTPGATVICTARTEARQFTVPADVLLQLPASKRTLDGIFSLGTAPLSNAGNFTAQGLESGQFTFSQTVVRSVTYQ